MSIGKLKQQFNKAYQKPTTRMMAAAVKTLLHNEIPVAYRESFHYKWLIEQCDRNMDNENELPGLMYGMFIGAFDELCKDLMAGLFGANPYIAPGEDFDEDELDG